MNPGPIPHELRYTQHGASHGGHLTRVFRSSVEQQRLNTDAHVQARLAAMQDRPDDFIISSLPEGEYSDNRYMFTHLAERMRGKLVLDLGCGDGNYAVYALSQGARRVHAVDISHCAALATRLLAGLNGVGDRLTTAVMDGGRLAYQDRAFDVVFGRAVLHHFDDDQIESAISEVHRVLKVGGRAVFLEPVEDSRLFEWIQQLLPAGRAGEAYYRPSRLSRAQFRRYIEAGTDAPLTTTFLLRSGRNFERVRIQTFGLFIRFDRFTWSHPWGLAARRCLDRIDGLLFRRLPFLRRYCRTAVVRYDKRRL